MPIRDIQLNATEDFPLFSTRVDTGAPTDVAGIVVSAYPDNSATQITAGITVSSPDSIPGYANVRVVATVANGYAFGSHYTLVITTGTVNSVSVVGAIVGEFTIRKNVPGLIRAFIAQASTSTTLVMDAAASFGDNTLRGHFALIVAGTGVGQSAFVDSNVGSTDTLTISPAWITTPDTTSVCELYGTPPASTGAPVPANATQILGTAIPTPTVAGVPNVNVKTINDVATTSVTAVNANQGTTQPVNFTGTAGSALVKGDTVDVAGTAVPAGAIPNAVAGAAGGLFIAGTNAPVTITGSGTALTLTSTGANGQGLAATGNGSGHGVLATGGGTGHGISAVGGGTSGAGISAVAATSGSGVVATGAGTTKPGILATGGGTTSAGIQAVGGGTSGDGILVTTTSGHGINLAPVGTSKHGLFATGGNGGTSDGISAVAGTGGVAVRAPTLTVTTPVLADLKKINGTTVNGDGAGTPWGP